MSALNRLTEGWREPAGECVLNKRLASLRERMGWLKHCACERTVTENFDATENAGDEENGGDSLPFFLFPGHWSPPLLPRGMWLTNRTRGDAQAQGAAMRPRRARDPTRGGHCPMALNEIMLLLLLRRLWQAMRICHCPYFGVYRHAYADSFVPA